MIINDLPVSALRPAPDNERAHDEAQVRQIAESIRAFGFNDPIGCTEDGEIVEGEGRWRAAQLLGLDTVPCVQLPHLTPAQRRAYRVAHNKLALNSRWDPEKLLASLDAIASDELPVALMGFSTDDLARLADDQAAQQLGTQAGEQRSSESGAGGSRDRGGADYDYVPLNVVMAKDDRDKIYAAVQKAKRLHGLSRTDEALVAIVTEWEQGHAD